jgi:hypothetical protein
MTTAILYGVRNFTNGGWSPDDRPWGPHTTLYTAKAPATSEINFRKGLQKYKPWKVCTDDLRVVEVPVSEPEC